MPELYLSPASIGYLAQFVLCFAMTGALLVDSVKRKHIDSRVLLVFGFLFRVFGVFRG